jgi:hypothetical protein
MSPLGTLRVWDAATHTWHRVRYVTQGTGMDYLQETQLPAFGLAPGATASTTYRLALKPTQERLYPGSSIIDVTLEHGPSHQVLGTNPAVSVPVTVSPT